MSEIDLVPGGTIMRQGENIAFPVPDRECHQRLVAGQQTLDVVRGQGLRVGQRRVIRKLARQRLLQLRTFGRDCGEPVCGPLLGGSVSLFRLGRDRCDHSVVKPLCLGAQILVVTDQQGQVVAPGGKADREFCNGRASRIV